MSFQHSIKVPRLYKTAAKIAQEVHEGASLKQLVYQKKHPNLKALYALVALSFQWDNEIEHLFKRSNILKKEPRLDPWLAKILITELLWGKNKLGGQSKPIQTILAYEQIFKAHLSDTYITANTQDHSYRKPRYARVNTLKLPVDDAVNLFRNDNWILCKHFDTNDYAGFLQKIEHLEENQFLIDIHIPSLLIFPPKTEFFKHNAYKNGGISLQDKASCLPVHILNPPEDSVVLDMCAAPGMKTTQLAAVMNNKGKIYAVERDQTRFQTLNKMIVSSGATCVEMFNEDILKCDPAMFPGVEYILVDPSCSGSGMSDRLDFQAKESESRLDRLAGFQIMILRKALTKFPKAKRVVYSTCSVYVQENEEVVKQVLETNYLYKLVPATKYLGNNWHNFGSSDYGNIGKYCLYSKPKEDFTNGFFVAIFERLNPDENNEFFNAETFNMKKREEDEKTWNNYQEKSDKLDTLIENTKKGKVKRRKSEETSVAYHPKAENQYHEVIQDKKEKKERKEILKKKEKVTKKASKGVDKIETSTIEISQKRKKKHKTKYEGSRNNTKDLNVKDLAEYPEKSNSLRKNKKKKYDSIEEQE